MGPLSLRPEAYRCDLLNRDLKLLRVSQRPQRLQSWRDQYPGLRPSSL